MIPVGNPLKGFLGHFVKFIHTEGDNDFTKFHYLIKRSYRCFVISLMMVLLPACLEIGQIILIFSYFSAMA